MWAVSRPNLQQPPACLVEGLHCANMGHNVITQDLWEGRSIKVRELSWYQCWFNSNICLKLLGLLVGFLVLAVSDSTDKDMH